MHQSHMPSFEFRMRGQAAAEIEVVSDRLRLIPIDDRFAEDVFREFTLEITRFMFPKPAEDIDETRAFIRQSQEGVRQGRDIIFAITDKTSGEFLGCCGCHCRNNPRTPELGIWIKKSGHGSGYGREAVRAVKEWAEKALVCESFVYPVAKQNSASRRIAESLGGVVSEEAVVTNLAGIELDEVIYTIPKSAHP